MKWSTHGKLFVLVAMAILLQLRSALLGDQHVSAGELVQVIIALVMAANTWLVPNLPQWPWLKQAVIGIMAISELLVTAATNWHITGDELVNLAIVFVGAVFGLAAPSLSEPMRNLGMYRSGQAEPMRR